METQIITATDADFEWMLQSAESSRGALRLPLGGVDDPSLLEHVRAMANNLRRRGYDATWMMVSNGEVVGLCGYHQPPSMEGEVEIGYNVAPRRRRSGHATRAVSAILELARNDPAIKSIVASTPVQNIASQRVLERNGFERCGERTDPEDGRLILWRTGTSNREN
jgi:RimJ/RimL family protein N-acetyltransferase